METIKRETTIIQRYFGYPKVASTISEWRSHQGVKQSKLCYPLRIPPLVKERTLVRRRLWYCGNHPHNQGCMLHPHKLHFATFCNVSFTLYLVVKSLLSGLNSNHSLPGAVCTLNFKENLAVFLAFHKEQLSYFFYYQGKKKQII